NTTIPTSKSEVFSTAADGQTTVEVHVLQGERAMSAENKSLGRFILDGILPAPRGVPQIEVAFDLDANGILNVSAKDKATGKQQRITITASSGLAKDEVERLVRDAEGHAAEDQRRRQEVETRNMAESLVYNAEKMLRENKDHIPQDLQKEVETEVASLRAALQGKDNAAAISAAVNQLQQTMQKVGAAVYSRAGGPGQPEGPGPAGGPGPTGGPPPSDGGAPPGGTVEGQYRDV
ncbi:MAG: Hsp70 family protein, partial [Chloroflexi bacterium]|nr:Hsp70 family protein [Chloroflexota bacterium]